MYKEKIMNNNLNENFLLTLLEQADAVYHQKDQYDNHLYFYPKNLGMTVQIPCIESPSLNVNFVKETRMSKDKGEVVNFYVPHYNEVPNFLAKMYGKLEDMLNGRGSQEDKGLFDELLKKPLDKMPHFTLNGEDNSLKVVLREKDAEVIIHIGRAFLSHSNAKVRYNALEPIKLEIYWKNQKETQFHGLTKIIPAYEVSQYPLLNKYASVTKHNDGVLELLETLSKKVDKENFSFLHSLILDMELSQKEEKKKTKINKV